MEKTGRKLAEMDLVEINEAFGAQVLACLKGLKWDERDRLNLNDSDISPGHPIGARARVS
jgi:acetyl-CoA C-acetyltransferase